MIELTRLIITGCDSSFHWRKHIAIKVEKFWGKVFVDNSAFKQCIFDKFSNDM